MDSPGDTIVQRDEEGRMKGERIDRFYNKVRSAADVVFNVLDMTQSHMHELRAAHAAMNALEGSKNGAE